MANVIFTVLVVIAAFLIGYTQGSKKTMTYVLENCTISLQGEMRCL